MVLQSENRILLSAAKHLAPICLLAGMLRPVMEYTPALPPQLHFMSTLV